MIIFIPSGWSFPLRSWLCKVLKSFLNEYQKCRSTCVQRYSTKFLTISEEWRAIVILCPILSVTSSPPFDPLYLLFSPFSPLFSYIAHAPFCPFQSLLLSPSGCASSALKTSIQNRWAGSQHRSACFLPMNKGRLQWLAEMFVLTLG